MSRSGSHRYLPTRPPCNAAKPWASLRVPNPAHTPTVHPAKTYLHFGFPRGTAICQHAVSLLNQAADLANQPEGARHQDGRLPSQSVVPELGPLLVTILGPQNLKPDCKSLPMYMHGLYALRAAVPSGSSLYSLPIPRGFTHVSTVYVTF